MGRVEKPKTKAAPRSKPPHFDDKAQSKRFIEAARELGVTSEHVLDNAFDKIAKLKKRPS